MPIYVVYMRQGVTIQNLTGNTLATGVGEAEDALQSCSAVVLVNTGNLAAGLYHFPAGDIDVDHYSQGVLKAMAAAVHPNEFYIFRGSAEFKDPMAGAHQKNRTLEVQTKLTQYVRDRLGAVIPRVNGRMSKTGKVTVSTNGPQVVFGDLEPYGYIDLRKTPPANHGAYVTYGNAK